MDPLRKLQFKKYGKQVGLFLLTVVGTLFVTWIWNKAIPDSPIVVKEITDSVRIIHDYNFLVSDSSDREIKKQIENLKLLNDYQEQIERRIISIRKNEVTIIPNLILTDELHHSYEGFVESDASGYLTTKCPNIQDSEYIDFVIEFFNKSMMNEIAFLRVNIYRINEQKGERNFTYVLSEFYQVKQSDNFIRIENNLTNGKYQIRVGFTLKKDIQNKYPTFYFKKCDVIKS